MGDINTRGRKGDDSFSPPELAAANVAASILPKKKT
jgi:hypothetical protein